MATGQEAGFILTEIRHAYMIPRLMRTPVLPDNLDPWRLTAEGGRLEGALALAALPRLAAALNRTDGVVAVALVAGVDPGGVRFIAGTLQTQVELVCQRCLGLLSWPLDVGVSLGLVHSEAEAERLPDKYEPLLAPEGVLCVADLVEDELLLALPQIPHHTDVRDCETSDYQLPVGASTPVAPGQSLAALASLLSDLKRSH